MSSSAFIRPAWTPLTIAMMIFGFMIFWPLGLAMLAYILWGDRLDDIKRDINQATDGVGRAFKRKNHSCGFGRHPHVSQTGNLAFDEWRDEELKRLEEERRRLNEMRQEFDDHLRELRRAKDREEFDTFMAARKKAVARRDKPAGGTSKTVPDA